MLRQERRIIPEIWEAVLVALAATYHSPLLSLGAATKWWLDFMLAIGMGLTIHAIGVSAMNRGGRSLRGPSKAEPGTRESVRVQEHPDDPEAPGADSEGDTCISIAETRAESSEWSRTDRQAIYCLVSSTLIVILPMVFVLSETATDFTERRTPPLIPFSAGASSLAFKLTTAASAGLLIAVVRLISRLLSLQAKDCPRIFALMRVEACLLGMAWFGLMLMVDPWFRWITAPGRQILALACCSVACVQYLRLERHRNLVLVMSKCRPILIRFYSWIRPSHPIQRSSRPAKLMGASGMALSAAILWSMTIAEVAATASAATTAADPDTYRSAAPAKSHVHGAAASPSSGPSSTPSTSQALPAKPRSGGSSGGGGLTTYFYARCGSHADELPGFGAPNTTVQGALYSLWLGGGAPGATVAGCPQRIGEVSDAYDTVYYQVGTDSHGVESIGLYSLKNGPVMFLQDGGAAQYVIEKIRSGDAFSGLPRTPVGNGDAQIGYDEDGSTLFIRPVVHPTGHLSTSEPYVILPPAAASAWLYERTQNGFLWPSTSVSSDGEETVQLSVEPYGSPVASITFDPSGLSATSEDANGTTSFTATGQLIPEADLP